jgi:molecular chaperone GrpE
MYYNRRDYPYRRIPVRRANPRHGTRPSLYPDRGTESNDRLERSNGAAEPEATPAPETEAPVAPVKPEVDDHNDESSPAEPDWQAKALSLQAEMDNFRKRQVRRADEAVVQERERLLQLTLTLADNLERALGQDTTPDAAFHRGVELTHRELVRQLEAEGVKRLETLGHPFDPKIHEALATVPGEQAEPNTVAEEVEAGYMLADKLLRPARVVVTT